MLIASPGERVRFIHVPRRRSGDNLDDDLVSCVDGIAILNPQRLILHFGIDIAVPSRNQHIWRRDRDNRPVPRKRPFAAVKSAARTLQFGHRNELRDRAGQVDQAPRSPRDRRFWIADFKGQTRFFVERGEIPTLSLCSHCQCRLLQALGRN